MTGTKAALLGVSLGLCSILTGCAEPDVPMGFESPEEPEDPEDPEDPDVPVDPEDPEDPDTPVDPDDPGGVTPVCGNNVVEEGEECDYWSEDDLDGCLADCRFGPIGFTFGPINPTPYAGDPTSAIFIDDLPCDEGQMLHGFRASTPFMGQGIDDLCARCTRPALAQHPLDGVYMELWDTDETFPGTNGECPDGSVMIGARVRIASPGIYNQIMEVTAVCAPVYLVDDGGGLGIVVDADARVDAPTLGDPVGVLTELSCEDGEVATGIGLGREGNPSALSLQCRAIDLELAQ